jgi:NTF2 fold immunity protein of polymorphic toxin system component
MNRACLIVLLLATFVLGSDARKNHPGYVPDKKAAERIGEAVLIGQYGSERVDTERPLLVDDSNKDYWIVQMAPRKNGIPEIGGGPAVWINKHSGCLQVMEHMK